MATPASQEIAVHTDSSNAVPRRAWSDVSGIFAEAGAASGLTVLRYSSAQSKSVRFPAAEKAGELHRSE